LIVARVGGGEVEHRLVAVGHCVFRQLLAVRSQ
jgi:hypothetical protein